MKDITMINNKELTLDELDSVSGGDQAMWRALDVIFNGADMWRSYDDLVVDFSTRFKLAKKIQHLTGIEVDIFCVVDDKRDVSFKLPDGTLLNEEQFLDRIKATYSMDEILAWQSM